MIRLPTPSAKRAKDAQVIILVFAGFSAAMLVFAIIDIALPGGTHGAQLGRALVAMAGCLVVALVLVGIAAGLGRDRPWARWTALTTFVVIAGAFAWFSIWDAFSRGQGDGAAYVLMGGLGFAMLSLVGALLLVRKQETVAPGKGTIAEPAPHPPSPQDPTATDKTSNIEWPFE